MFTKEDSQLLSELAKKCKDAKEVQRLRALYAVSIGHPVSTVAQIFCVDEATIYRWIERWQQEKDLSDKPKEGRPEKLTDDDKEEIKKLIEENNPGKCGVNATLWDCKELQYYFHMKGKNISDETIRVYLKKTRARFVKATLKYAEADREKQEAFAREFFKRNKLKADSVLVFFQDEMSAGTSPRKGYGWTFEKRLVIKAPQKKKERLNCFGAVNPYDGEMIKIFSKDPKAPSFIRLLSKIEKKHPRKTTIVYTDNWKVHKAEKVKTWLKRRPNVQLIYLPSYSPDLNPQEGWHNYKRQKLLNNKVFRSRHQLALAMHRFARKVPPERIKSICSLKPLENLIR